MNLTDADTFTQAALLHYEQIKAQWLREHPDATAEEVEAFLKALAQTLEV